MVERIRSYLATPMSESHCSVLRRGNYYDLLFEESRLSHLKNIVRLCESIIIVNIEDLWRWSVVRADGGGNGADWVR